VHRAREDLAARVARAAADADDTGAQAFLASLKFAPVNTRERSSPQGRLPVLVWERPLFPR
jgi:hypothetical protein